MWLLRLPLPPEQRIELPRGRHLFPWYFGLDETSRLADVLTGLLVGVDHHIVLPWQAVQSLVLSATSVTMAKTLVLITVEDPAVPDEMIDSVIAHIDCLHAFLQLPRPHPTGYAWQERYLKPHLMTLLQEDLGNERHPLARLNIAALPVRLAATLTTEALGLVELLEATAEHRFAHTAEGISEKDYETSLYAVAGQRFAERLRRLRPDQIEPALDVLRVEGAGVWSDERFRAGAEALEEVGLAQVGGGSVSLGPLARRANDPRLFAALKEMASAPLPIASARRWVIETAPILLELRAAREPDNFVAFARAAVTSASGLRQALTDGAPVPVGPRGSLDPVRRWIREGLDFNDRCRRAEDFLSDPDRAKVVRDGVGTLSTMSGLSHSKASLRRKSGSNSCRSPLTTDSMMRRFPPLRERRCRALRRGRPSGAMMFSTERGSAPKSFCQGR